MKRLTTLLGGLPVIAAVALLPYNSRATIIGSKHDFTSYTNYWINGVTAPGLGFGGSTNVCGECHTMHHANPDRVAPLWDHATTLQTFTVYNSPTFNGGTPTIDGASRACLSCHDGSVAINQTYNATGTNYSGGSAVYIAGSAIIP